MMKIFFVDSDNDTIITYDEVVALINQSNQYIPCFQSSKLTEFLLNFISGLTSGKNLTLIDSDLSVEEVNNLEIPEELFIPSKIELLCTSVEDLILKIANSKSEITLFTSGTTGRPKTVIHTVGSLTKAIKQDKKYSDNVWAYCYNPTHMAGLQVFFQAVLNQNTLVYLFGKDKEFVFSYIDKYKITNISATPTFYRLLIPWHAELPTVKKVTFGGEKTEKKLIEKLKTIFVEAKFYNVYASTELGALFASDGEFFEVPEKIKDKVQVVDNELCVHTSLMPEAFQSAVWYSTGDLVEVLCSDPLKFKFVGRKTEMINSGGYKINPKEIEEEIMLVPGVLYAKVFAKKNSVLGSILCAEVFVEPNANISEPMIRSYLSEKLQEFKIPRVIKFAQKLEMTKNGKIL